MAKKNFQFLVTVTYDEDKVSTLHDKELTQGLSEVIIEGIDDAHFSMEMVPDTSVKVYKIFSTP